MLWRQSAGGGATSHASSLTSLLIRTYAMALFGKKEPPARPVEDMTEELKALLAKATDERTKISSLLGRTKGSVEKLEKLDTPLRAVVEKADIVAEQIKRLEDRATSLDPLITRLAQAGQ